MTFDLVTHPRFLGSHGYSIYIAIKSPNIITF